MLDMQKDFKMMFLAITKCETAMAVIRSIDVFLGQYKQHLTGPIREMLTEQYAGAMQDLSFSAFDQRQYELIAKEVLPRYKIIANDISGPLVHYYSFRFEILMAAAARHHEIRAERGATPEEPSASVPLSGPVPVADIDPVLPMTDELFGRSGPSLRITLEKGISLVLDKDTRKLRTYKKFLEDNSKKEPSWDRCYDWVNFVKDSMLTDSEIPSHFSSFFGLPFDPHLGGYVLQMGSIVHKLYTKFNTQVEVALLKKRKPPAK